MKNLILFLTFCFSLSSQLTAQTTKIQVIHNSPDPMVDIYANGVLLLNDFVYRTATPYVDVPTGTSVVFGIAPATSTSVADAVAYSFQTFEASKNYYLTATGIIGNTTTPFAVNVDEGARTVASNPAKVDVSVFHGSTDAPAVDIEAVGVGNIISGLSYNSFTPYLSLDPGVYDLAIKPAGTSTVVATYRADISGLAGKSVRITATGLLNGTPAFGLLATLADGTSFLLPLAPPVVPVTTKVQVIHNSASPTVDIYANGTLLLNDFVYRTATPFVDLPTGTPISVAVAPGNSTSVNDAIATFPVTFAAGKNYIVTAAGVVGNAATPFTLIADDAVRTQAANAAKVDVSVLHGATDAPAVDVEAVGVGNIITNLAYGQFTSTLSLDPGVYDLAIKPAGTSTVVATYRADISGLAGKSVRITATGLLNGTPAFGLLATLADGTSFLLPLAPPVVPVTTKVQVIHNSASPTVDIYANGTLLLNDFVYRTATPFVDLPTGTPISVAVAPGNSTSVNDAIATFPVTFAAGKNYIVTAAGVVGNAATPFTLIADDAVRTQAANAAKVDVSVLHGATDAPAVDVEAVGVGNIITNLAYGQFTGTLSLDPGVYDLAIKPAGTSTVVATYRADISGLAGKSVRITATGLLNGTPAFGLLATLADGTSFLLPLTPPVVPVTTKVQVIHNSASPTVDIYANGTLLLNDFVYRTATPFVDLPTGTPISVAVAPGNSTSVNDAIVTFPVTFAAGKNYIVTAAGVVGNAATPFTLIADDAVRTQAANAAKVDVSVLHGATDAPAVDVEAVGVGNIITNLAYGQFTGTLSLDPGVYDLAIKPAGTSTVVATYRADISGLAGKSVRITATGLLNGTPAFGLLATLADGTSFLLPLAPPVVPVTTKVQVIHNSASPTVDIYANGTLLLNDFVYRTATPFVDLPTGTPISVAVAPGNSTSVNDAIATFPVTFAAGKNYIVTAAGVVGNAATPFTLLVSDNAKIGAAAGKVDISILHGATNAPAVDIEVQGAGNVVTNLSYTQSTGYLTVDPADYVIIVKPAGSNMAVGRFRGNLTGLAGKTVRITASGLLGGTPAFALIATLEDGTTIVLDQVSNTNELETSISSFEVFPNPAQDQTTLSLELTEARDLSVRIRDVQGKVVSTQELGNIPAGVTQLPIRLEQFTSGQYFLEVLSAKGIRTTKITVIK
jgi:Domain of unknown function (DUF4397)/Secretion system C-terminal sorting domain